MHADAVIDASVLAAALFNEEKSEAARRWLVDLPPLAAPDLLHVELASIAAKKVWQGRATSAMAERAIRDIDLFVRQFAPSAGLALQAARFAIEHRFSAYDATYLALASRLNVKMATLDGKLVKRAEEVGLGHLVHLIPSDLQRP